MANLTTKELSALEDQLGAECMMTCKYKQAAQESTEADLRTAFQQFASQHKQNYDNLIKFLK
jgi:hypothetical protein